MAPLVSFASFDTAANPLVAVQRYNLRSRFESPDREGSVRLPSHRSMHPKCPKALPRTDLPRRFMPGRMQIQMSCLLAALLIGSVSHSAHAQSPEIERYFDGLRSRQLYVLAETACETRLADPQLPDSLRWQYSLQLSRTLTEHARSAGPEERKLQWQRASDVLRKLLSNPAAVSQKPRIETQLALITATRGEHLRWRSALAPFDEELRNQARQTLDQATQELRKVETDLSALVQASLRRKTPPGELQPHELRQLEYNVRYRLGSTLLDYAELYPSGAAERIGAVIEAEEIFRRFSGGPPGDRMTVLGSIMLARCYRLQGRLEGVDDKLARLREVATSLQLLEVLVAEQARLRLAIGQPTEAAQLLIDYRKSIGRLPGELHFLRLRSLIASWKIARQLKREPLAQQLLQQIRQEAAVAETESEPFWAQRCLQLLRETETTDTYGGELAKLVQQANALYQASELASAVALYEQAGQWAAENSQAERTPELWNTAGAIALKAGHHVQAAEIYQRVYTDYPKASQAAEAHMLRAFCLGVVYDKERTAERRLAYTAALQEHLKLYPTVPSSSEAHWMLGRLMERRLQYTKALPHFLAINPTSARAVDGQVHAARCFESILDRLRILNRDQSAWRQQAVDRLTPFALTLSTERQLSLAEREILIRLARIEMTPPANYRAAATLLDRAAQSDARDTADQRSSDYGQWVHKLLVQLRIVALAAQGQPQTAQRLIRQLADDDVSEVLIVLNGLSEVARNQSVEVIRSIGELQLATAEGLQARRSLMSPDQQRNLDRCLGEALLATDQPKRAVDLYEQLVKNSPRDQSLLEQAAEVMVRSGDPRKMPVALDYWRRIEDLHPDGSVQWIRARYNSILCSWESGATKEAIKLMKLTRLLYPKLGSPDWKQKFDELEAEIDPSG